MIVVPFIAAIEGGDTTPMKDKLQGKVEELKGRLTGDKSEETKGEARQHYGDVKDKARDVRDDVSQFAGDVRDDENDRDESV